MEKIASLFDLYEKKLRQANALDFDDLLLKTVQLFYKAAEVCEQYNRRFQYVLVDEYQDTNRTQYQLIRQLTLMHQNLCVVGDEDQSIYRWRGADIQNILSFEKDYPNARDRSAGAELSLHAEDSRRGGSGGQPQSGAQGKDLVGPTA